MTVNLSSALAAYRNAANGVQKAGLDAPKTSGGDFSGLVKEAINSSAAAIAKGEAVSVKAIAGKAELTDVVTAVTSAELTLQTVVAVRDRVIQAYQEIVRMPI
jgi:flagellar hook-basal body complex protein FliE